MKKSMLILSLAVAFVSFHEVRSLPPRGRGSEPVVVGHVYNGTIIRTLGGNYWVRAIMGRPARRRYVFCSVVPDLAVPAGPVEGRPVVFRLGEKITRSGRVHDSGTIVHFP